MGKTFAEKILSKRVGKDVSPPEIVEISPDLVMSHDNAAAISGIFSKLGLEKVKNPDQIIIILDHCVPAATEKYAQNHKTIREFVKKQEIGRFYDINRGVCHQVLPEKGHARPGMVILGSDSHTTSYGGVGAFSAGIGRSEVAVIWATGKIWLRVPETIRINVRGAFPPGLGPKDLVLWIIGELGADGALYKAVEFGGETIQSMETGGRMVLANMSAEMGAKIGYVEADEITREWLSSRVQGEIVPVCSDPDAEYEDVLEFNVEGLEPRIACPHTVDNVEPVTQVAGKPIQQALIGTCTNGRLEDLEAAALMVKGKTIAKGVRLLVFPASMEVYVEAMEKGILRDLVESGAVIMNPGCGPCLGAHEGTLAPGEVCISTANRNFKGRMGCKEAEVYLASPSTVAASAIKGEIADCREFL